MPACYHRLSSSWVRLIGLAALVVLCQGESVRASGRTAAQYSGVNIIDRVRMENGNLVQFCTVKLEGTNIKFRQFRNSGTRGVYKFEDVQPGSYVVSGCWNLPYKFRKEYVIVGSDQTPVVIRNLTQGRAQSTVAGKGRRRGRNQSCLIVSADGYSEPLSAKPGKTLFVPIIIQNNCRQPDIFDLRLEAPSGTTALILEDSNADRNYQESEPATSQTRLLQPPRKESPLLNSQRLLLRIYLPSSVQLKQKLTYRLSARSGTNRRTSGHTDIVVVVTADPT